MRPEVCPTSPPPGATVSVTLYTVLPVIVPRVMVYCCTRVGSRASCAPKKGHGYGYTFGPSPVPPIYLSLVLASRLLIE